MGTDMAVDQGSNIAPSFKGVVQWWRARDLRKLAEPMDNSRWLLVDQPNSLSQVVLVSPDADEIATFKYPENSGTGRIRARAHALVWAQDNDIAAPAVPQGDLVFEPIRPRG